MRMRNGFQQTRAQAILIIIWVSFSFTAGGIGIPVMPTNCSYPAIRDRLCSIDCWSDFFSSSFTLTYYISYTAFDPTNFCLNWPYLKEIHWQTARITSTRILQSCSFTPRRAVTADRTSWASFDRGKKSIVDKTWIHSSKRSFNYKIPIILTIIGKIKNCHHLLDYNKIMLIYERHVLMTIATYFSIKLVNTRQYLSPCRIVFQIILSSFCNENISSMIPIIT